MTKTSIVRSAEHLSFPWQTKDPFLFCVHHDDNYPEGNDLLGPNASLRGRNIGMDFEGIDGWRMYHGDVVPGFPQHPHRGFETITLVRRGRIDHSDSLGATARFGDGDVQWMTAGKGVVHAEMFPLLHKDKRNHVELFQIWINLPKKSKMVEPHFKMLWNETIPHVVKRDENGKRVELTVVAGTFESAVPPSPPPNSYASEAGADVALVVIKLEKGARYTVAPAQPGTTRSLAFFRGGKAKIGVSEFSSGMMFEIVGDVPAALEAVDEECEFLLMQGKPIGEPVVQYGPFVMNTSTEIQQAFADYRRTGFGGWPWPSNGPVHRRDVDRFAIHADGRLDTAQSSVDEKKAG